MGKQVFEKSEIKEKTSTPTRKIESFIGTATNKNQGILAQHTLRRIRRDASLDSQLS
jgi:hypothetical protein